MDIFAEIADKLDVKRLEKIKFSKASGCISSGQGYHTENGDIFVKHNTKSEALPMFFGELISLKALKSTATIGVPEPLCVVEDPKSTGGAIVMEYLAMTPITEWKMFGSQLADLHLFNSVLEKKKDKLSSWIGRPPKSDVPDDDRIVFEKEVKLQLSDEQVHSSTYVDQFGFEGPTYCGMIEQNNDWHDNWIEFYARNKLDLQIRLLTDNVGDREVVEYWSELQLMLDRLFRDIRRPIKPALLHGDLWSGNASQVDGRPVIYDPACFYGHSEFELSIAMLFGGFDSAFFDEYFSKIPKEKGFELRTDLYKLFHTLNHWNHFGSHKRQTKDLMKKLIKNCKL